MKRYILAILLLVLISHAGQASRYAGGRAWNNAERTMRGFLGRSPDHRALHIICEGHTRNMQQHQALVLQPTGNFDNGTALATALTWAVDPDFAGDPKGYAARKIAESDPVAMAAKAEAAAAEAARLAAEQQERERQAAEAAAEAARVLEQERQEAERLAAVAASVTQDGLSDAVSDHESDRTSPSSVSITDADINKPLFIRTPAEIEKSDPTLVVLRHYARAPRPDVPSTPGPSRYARYADAARMSGQVVYRRAPPTSSQGTPSTDSILTPSPYGASPFSLMSRLGLGSPAEKGDVPLLPASTPTPDITDDPTPLAAAATIGVGASGGPILPRELDASKRV